MNILKTLQQLQAATEKGSGKQMFLKSQEILKDFKSERNPLKMLKGTLMQIEKALINYNLRVSKML